MSGAEETSTDSGSNGGDPLDAFLERYFRDADAGAVRPLTEYLEEFPEETVRVREEYAALEGVGSTDPESSFFFADAGEDPLTVADVPDASHPPSRLTCFGDWRLAARIGGGGMGVVFLALDPAGRPAALKLSARSWSRNENEKLRMRFLREMHLASAIDHPHVVGVLETGVLHGRPYLVTELVRGGNLAQLLETSGPLPWPLVLHLARDVFDGLDAIHGAGAIHRDVKPSNVLLHRSGRALVADFGLARPDRPDRTFYTSSKRFLGTLDYASPEQVTGSHEIGRATDLYGAGATLYTLLTGRPVLEAASIPAVADFHLAGEVPRVEEAVPSVPRDVAALVSRLLAKDPSRRPDSARACRSEIERLLDASGAPEAEAHLARLAGAQERRLAARLVAASIDLDELSRRPTAAGDQAVPAQRVTLKDGDTVLASRRRIAGSETLELSRLTTAEPAPGSFRIAVRGGRAHLEGIDGGDAVHLNGRAVGHDRPEPLFDRNELELGDGRRIVIRTRRGADGRVDVGLWEATAG